MNRVATSRGSFMADGRARHLAGSGRLVEGRVVATDRPPPGGLVSQKGTWGPQRPEQFPSGASEPSGDGTSAGLRRASTVTGKR
jgi:hypothetical protein